jgi:SAM-dependent methyltransferase
MHIKPVISSQLLRTILSHPPQLIECEICRSKRLCIRTHPVECVGSRCLGCKSTAHHRGVFAVIRELYGDDLEMLRGGSVYEISAHGALHAALAKRREIRFTCSEFLDEWIPGQVYNGVRCENVEALTFARESFDLITCTGMFEHVENDAAGFSEIARVLKPTGYFIFTVPYHDGLTYPRGVRLDDGSIRHLMPPEYHGDPFRGEAGVYTWRNYGRDIVDIMASSGLAAEVRQLRVSGMRGRLPVVVAQRR